MSFVTPKEIIRRDKGRSLSSSLCLSVDGNFTRSVDEEGIKRGKDMCKFTRRNK